MDTKIFFFHSISNWRSTIKIINLYMSPPIINLWRTSPYKSYNKISTINSEKVATKKNYQILDLHYSTTRYYASCTKKVVSLPDRVDMVHPLPFSLPLSQKAQSPPPTHTQKRMLSHLIVNSAKMERLLGKLWTYSSWPITSHRKCLQCGVFWNLKLANC